VQVKAFSSSLQILMLRLCAMVVLVFGGKRAALRLFACLLALRPADAHALASHAHLQAQLGDSEEAIAGFKQLTAAHDDNAAAWFNLGYLFQQNARHREAEQAFRRAVALDDKLDRAWYGLGLALMQQSRFEDAASALQQATVLQPMSPHGWFRLAEVRRALGQTAEAEKIIAHLKQFEPRVASQLERQQATYAAH
jgi:tetratricopeptide (TPR) repeat protein